MALIPDMHALCLLSSSKPLMTFILLRHEIILLCFLQMFVSAHEDRHCVSAYITGLNVGVCVCIGVC